MAAAVLDGFSQVRTVYPMRPHQFSFVSVLVAMALLTGCSADKPTNEPSSSENAVESCMPQGQVACDCPDGTKSGTQTCAVDGALSLCTCPPPTSSGGAGGSGGGAGGAGGAGVVTSGSLCKDLADVTSCTAQGYESKELPASVLFLVDRSGSMSCNTPDIQPSDACEAAAAPVDPSKPSKWAITTDALKQVFDMLGSQGSTASVGLSFFSNDDVCGVQSAPTVGVNPLSDAQVLALNNALDQTQPSGGTPLVGATTLAYAYLHQEATMASGCTEPCGAHGNRFLVLISDGADSCPMPATAQDADNCTKAGGCTSYLVKEVAPKAAGANIRTFVVGVPGSEPARGYLSELAFIGGTGRNHGSCAHDPTITTGDCHFDMSSSQDLAADLATALADISGAALGCEFAVPQIKAAVDSEHVNVQYRAAGTGEPTCLPYDDSPCEDGANGWQFAKNADGSDDLTRVVICGSHCDTIQSDVGAKVDVILGCMRLG